MKIIAQALLLVFGLIAPTVLSGQEEEGTRRLRLFGKDSSSEDAYTSRSGTEWLEDFEANGARIRNDDGSNIVPRTGLGDDGSDGRTRCRKKGLGPHMNSLWQQDFPDTNFDSPTALCEGTISVGGDNSICATGRVTYAQIAEVAAQSDRYIRSPAAGDISVPGHLISGSANFVLGSEATLAYDYVANYTIAGTTSSADATMTNNLLAASRGLIENVCFLPEFSATESYYKIKHDFWLPKAKNIDFDAVVDANIVYLGYFSAVAEYHTPTDKPFLSGHTQLFLITFVASIVPSFVFNLVPFLGFTGIFRLFTTGTMSTAKFPQPLDAPDATVENIQINTEWTTFLSAVQDGLFLDGDKKIPIYYGSLIKRIEASATNACWDVESAAIDIQAPKGWGDKLDEYVNDIVLPALQAHGTVDLHLGKRLDSDSSILQAAMTRYSTACGVELNIEPTEACYHPQCRRSSNNEAFTYPTELYS